MAKNIKAVIYARFSSHNQREESIDAQVRAYQKFASDNGILIVDKYCDSAKSATSDDRPEFQRMIADSSNNTFNAVIVHKLDRFARNRYDSAYYKRKLKLNGVTVMSVTEKLDNSPESVIMESMLEGMSEYYSMNLAREVMKGMKETAYQCKHTGGFAPLGYDVDLETKKYIINEEEAKIVRLIFELYNKGYGYKRILDDLHDKGYKTKFGNDFTTSSLRGILTNEKYTGVYLFNQKKEKADNNKRNAKRKPADEIIRIEGGMPAIIDKATFTKAMYHIEKNTNNGGKNSAVENYLLSGLIYCSCGGKMHGNRRYCGRDKQLLITYRCCNRSQHKDCITKEINKVYLDNFVMDTLTKNLFSTYTIDKISDSLKEYRSYQASKHKKDLQLYNQKLEQITKDIDSLISLAIRNNVNSESLKEKLATLEHNKITLEIQIKRLTTDIKLEKCETLLHKAIADSKHYFKFHDISRAKLVINEYIEKVVVSNSTVNIYFKINIPDENMVLNPLVVVTDRENIYKQYRPAI